MVRRTLPFALLLAVSCVQASPSDSLSGFNNQTDFINQLIESRLSDGPFEGATLVFWQDLSFPHGGYPEFNLEEARLDFLQEARERGPLVLEAAEDFWNKNRVPVHFSALGSLSREHVLLREKDEESTAPDGIQQAETISEEERFQRGFKSGIGTFSMPGFSNDGTVAVFYFSWYWGPLAGGGRTEVYFLEEGHWVRSSWCFTYNNWIS